MLTSEQIETHKKRMMQPKLWIHNENSLPPHRFAHSSRCVYCMTIMHRSEKCSTFRKGGAKK
jgi:hypothetical protein